MKGYIPDTKVEEVKNRTNIVDLVSEYITLKKAGRNFIGLCPFHKEKTPSFTVTPDRQMFYCFGCGEGGNVFSFLMKISQMSYPEAVRHLARKTGVVIPERTSAKEREEAGYREQLIRVNETVAAYYRKNLMSSSGKAVQSYLRKRGIRDEISETFRLGLAADGWHHLRDYLEKEKVSLKLAEDTGLLIAGKDQSLYDRFRGRLMFPIEDLSGRVAAFGGRIVGEGEPKYLNSPESVAYVKGKILYALNRSREAIRRQGYAIIVEGYFDLISLWNVGITHVVATLGTALTKDQIDLLSRYTTRVVALFDPDEAGRKALSRSLELFLAGRLNARALVLPEGHDPDDYVRSFGGDRLLELINRAPSLVDYYIDEVLGDAGGFETDRDSLRKATAFIRHIDNTIDRNLFIKRVSEKLGIDQALLKAEISHIRDPMDNVDTRRDVRRSEGDPLELNLIHLLLLYPEKISNIEKTGILDYFISDDLKQLGKTMIMKTAGSARSDTVELLNFIGSGTLRESLMKKFMEDPPPAEDGMEDRLIADTVRQIRRRWYKEKGKALKVNLMKAQEAGDAQLCNQLLMEKDRLLKEERAALLR